MTVTTVTAPTVPPRELVSTELLGSLSLRVQDDEGTDPETAGRIVDQALGFLLACALNPGLRLAPSRRVDAGWHAFILHTREYAEFCDRVAGEFIHHVPAAAGEDGGGYAAVAATDAMRAAGIPVDEDLWACGHADCESRCHQCHAGCYDSPRGK